EVCRQESITLAAESMNMAQPAVSHAVRELESYYGTKLFERMNRRLYITESGEQLLLYADSILSQFDEARDVLRDVHAVTKVRVGTNVSFGISSFPEILSEFSKEYPQIPFYTRIENSRQIEESLMRNELDFGIMDYPLNPRYFICNPVGKDIMTAVCAGSYKIKDQVTLEELCEYPLLLREKGSGSRNLTEEFVEKYKKNLNILMESISVQSLIEACSKGLGILIISKSIAESFMERYQLKEIKIQNTEATREYYFVYHKSKFLTKSMKAFQEYMMDWAEEV
ncbi:MAG: LysR family transcriptional regulator, partial [Bacillota bacterium]|nr:LysR family transcriptional regulator [Bacillota bacterium]